MPGPAPEELDRVARVAKPADVGDVPAGLHRHDEVGSGSAAPALEGLLLREHVERVVDLHGGEALGEVTEPLALGELGRVEPSPPIAVLPSAGADVDHACVSARCPDP